MLSSATAVLVAAILAPSLPAQQPGVTAAGDKAAAIGARLAANVRAQTTPLLIEPVDEYVTQLGRLLAPEIPNAPAHWEFTVVKQPGNWTHEPLGLPGGYVFVPAALIAAANDEAEFASMLAHSMVHAASPALVRWNGASVPLLFADTDPGLGGDGLALVPLSLRTAQQEREFQADVRAAEAVSHAGFDPSALLAYLRRAQNHLQSQAESAAASERLARLAGALRMIEMPSAGAHLRSPSRSFADLQMRVHEEERARTKPATVPSLISPPK